MIGTGFRPGDVFRGSVRNGKDISALALDTATKNGSDVTAAITLTVDTTLPAGVVHYHFTIPSGYSAGDLLDVGGTATDADGDFPVPLFSGQLVQWPATVLPNAPAGTPDGLPTNEGAAQIAQGHNKVWFVRTDGSDSNDGLSPATAKATIASILQTSGGLASAGDLVLVGPGLFAGESDTVLIPAGVTLKGSGRGTTEITVDCGDIDVTYGLIFGGDGACAQDLTFRAINGSPVGGDTRGGIIIQSGATTTLVDRVRIERCHLFAFADTLRGYYTNLVIADSRLEGQWDVLLADGACTAQVTDTFIDQHDPQNATGSLVNAGTAGIFDLVGCHIVSTGVTRTTFGVRTGGSSAIIRLQDCFIDVSGAKSDSTALTNVAGTIIVSRTTYDPAKTSGTITMQADPFVLRPVTAGRALSIDAASKVAATLASGDGADAAAIKTTIGTAGAGLTALAQASAYTAARAAKLDNLDATISSRLAASSYTTPPTKEQIASQVEFQIMDETDGQQVLTAIVNKINSVDADLSGLSISAIASAVWSNAGRTLSSFGFDVTLAASQPNYAPLTAGAYTAPDNAGIAAIKTQTDKLTFTFAGKLDANTVLWGGSALPTIPSAVQIANQTDTTLTAAHGTGYWNVAGGGGGLSGPSAVTLTFHDSDGNPVPLVDFSISGQGSARADGVGVAAFGLSDGTFTVVSRPTGGIIFANTQLVVSGSTALTITGANVAITPADDPARTTGFITCYDATGAVASGIVITIKLLGDPFGDAGASFSQAERDFTSAADGLIEMADLLRSRWYEARRGTGGWVRFQTADAPTTALPEILGIDA